MTETTQELRNVARAYGEPCDDNMGVITLRGGFVLKLINDADRLAVLERGVREFMEQRREAGEYNARYAENSALPQTERNRLRGMAEAREADYRLLRALLEQK